MIFIRNRTIHKTEELSGTTREEFKESPISFLKLLLFTWF